MHNEIFISGSIGYCKLQRDDKNVLIFSDNHKTSNYCNDKSMFIMEYLEKHKISSHILLEEVPRSPRIKLGELWETNPHTQGLKKFYLDNINLVVAIDIRPYMIPFSIIPSLDDKDAEILIKDYFKTLNTFFGLEKHQLREEEKAIITLILQALKNLKAESRISMYYNEIKVEYKNLYKKLNINEPISVIKNNTQVINEIDDILCKIMDWYCILSLLSDKRGTIIHAGLYHTENITRKLVNDYGFNIISCMGVTELDKIDPLELSCVSLSE